MTGLVIPLYRAAEPAEEISDEALVAACAVDDSAALGQLFDRHQAAVHRFLSRTAGASDAEDLVQETFAQVWRSARRFARRSAVRSWIFGIAANVARHHARSEARRRTALARFEEVALHEVSAQPDALAERRRAMRRLASGLTRLKHDHRVAFVMCDLEGVSGVEAARVLGIRAGTLWRRLHEARRALRRAIEPGGDG